MVDQLTRILPHLVGNLLIFHGVFVLLIDLDAEWVKEFQAHSSLRNLLLLFLGPPQKFMHNDFICLWVPWRIKVILGISFFQHLFNVKLSIAIHASCTKHIEYSIEKLVQHCLTLKLDSKLWHYWFTFLSIACKTTFE